MKKRVVPTHKQPWQETVHEFCFPPDPYSGKQVTDQFPDCFVELAEPDAETAFFDVVDVNTITRLGPLDADGFESLGRNLVESGRALRREAKKRAKAAQTKPRQTAADKRPPLDALVFVFGDNRNWGKGKTLEEALGNAKRPKKYTAYLAPAECGVDDLGGFVFPENLATPFQPIRLTLRDE